MIRSSMKSISLDDSHCERQAAKIGQLGNKNMAVTLHQFDCIEDYFVDADSRAMHLQVNLVKEQKNGLTIALAFIFLLAISAYLLRIASLQVLCPVAVFLMIQYLDRLRKSQTTFHFASSRLAAET